MDGSCSGPVAGDVGFLVSQKTIEHRNHRCPHNSLPSGSASYIGMRWHSGASNNTTISQLHIRLVLNWHIVMTF